MRNLLIAAALGVLGAATSAHSAPASGRVEFELVRNGNVEGRHIVEVAETASGLSVQSRVNMQVRAGPITLYRYEHACREAWSGAALQSLSCSTRKQGRSTNVSARRNAEAIVVSGAEGEARFAPGALPTSWWTMPPESTRTMINTETGEPMPVQVTHLGRETIDAGGNRVTAQRVRVQGTLTVDLWYDDAGRWIGCAFTAEGQRFTYRLVTPLERAPEGFAA